MDIITRSALIYQAEVLEPRRIADAIATHLKEMGHRVELFTANAIPEDLELNGYDGVIFGSALDDGEYAPRIEALIGARHRELQHMPAAFFSVSLSNYDDAEALRAESLACIERLIIETDFNPAIFASFTAEPPVSIRGFIKQMGMEPLGRRMEGEIGFDIADEDDYDTVEGADVEAFVEGFLGQIAAMVGRPGESASRPSPPL
ncbi:hypothetical protein DV096_13375 [Bradymonadaceae bacterium TMQ3]|uniref:Flavodoxin-like domain-containing protein n=1 Tax=Lujinxingia sediminis TaxID=2480984 RepID=A0ABY0CU09_9DELT|nr:flavodoxin domain-containing protein [Lujinxingia sediminis]RDV37498.1 hypothetical protein DV096_13375 [Bradymonadaceae bacterium TMQ3]RVU45813.1 hypothetical protein EA187_08620 [Lujinxingia sediminis]TXC75054.1 hypothetical protein FRC91_13270 [Bradymonadales bacterium TMQ1]